MEHQIRPHPPCSRVPWHPSSLFPPKLSPGNVFRNNRIFEFSNRTHTHTELHHCMVTITDVLVWLRSDFPPPWREGMDCTESSPGRKKVVIQQWNNGCGLWLSTGEFQIAEISAPKMFFYLLFQKNTEWASRRIVDRVCVVHCSQGGV